MNMRKKALGTVFLASFSLSAGAAEILFAHVGNYGPYIGNGNQLAQMLTDDGHNVTTRFLTDDIYDDYADFSQVFVYDLYAGADNTANQIGNYSNIANWYNALPEDDRNLIVDGRIISSTTPWVNPPETAWIQNYATQLDLRGGGLVMGTDHNTFANGGFNSILAQMGIDPVTGNQSPTQALVDSLSPLFVDSLVTCASEPTEQCVNDNSTTGFVPTGDQPNGQFLTPVAYHGVVSQAFDNAAVSSTIGSETFGTGECGGPDQDPCPTPVPGTALLAVLGLLGLGFARRA